MQAHDTNTLERLREVASWNGFASSLVRQYDSKGDLSVPQWQAAEKMFAKMDANKARKDALTTKVDVSKVETLFATAKANGLKRPQFRADGITMSLAGPRSRNAGAIYVKQSGAYMGKIMGGVFSPSRDADQTVADTIAKVAADPLGSAVQYGRDTGICACCGRTLTDPQSIAAGIGPICQTKWGL